MHNKKNNKIVLIALVLILCISIGYAFLSTVLKINSSLSLNKIAFDIHFDNVVTLTSKATVSEEAHLTNDDKNIISFSAALAEVGDYYRFTTDIVNDSTIPGKLKSIDLTGLDDSQKKLVKYTIKYTNSDKEVKVGDYLLKGSSKNITVELKYKLDTDITNDDIPSDNITLNCSLVIDYENTDIDELESRLAVSQLRNNEETFPSSILDFTKPSVNTDHQGLFVLSGTENDSHPIYFYRGENAFVNNHVNFANTCWRIIRTTNNGGIKMIYNGLPSDDGQCLNLTGDNVYLSAPLYSNNNSWDWSTSTLKSSLNTWYYGSVYSYREYVEDENYCNDNQYTLGRVSLDCDSEHVVSVSNGKNDYPFGLITAEEVNLVGYTTTSSRNSWIGSGKNFLTMSGRGEANSGSIWGLYFPSGGQIYSYTTGASTDARPVITLTNNITFDSGNGTQSAPYTVSLL